MEKKSFKKWFADVNYLEGECNCHIHRYLDDIMGSDDPDTILQISEYFMGYIKYCNEKQLVES